MTIDSIAIAWSGAVAATAAWGALRRAREPTCDDPLAVAPTIVLRPCSTDEPGLRDALRSSACAANARAIAFLVASPNDGAYAAAREIAGDLTASGTPAHVVLTDARGPNRKADQLTRAVERDSTNAAVIVVADSDVRLDDFTLRALVEPVASGRADASWAPPIEVAPRTAADRASAAVLDASMHAFGLLAGLDPRGMVGKLFAIRSDALADAGGFGALVSTLGEDMELARRLRARGRRVTVVGATAASLACGRTWRDVVARYARWITVIRAQRPALLASYPLLFTWFPLVLALSSVSVARGEPLGVVAMVVAMVVRVLVACAARACSRRSLAASPFAALAADVVLLAAFARALRSRSITWRGLSLRVGRDGTLAEVSR